MCSAKLPIEQFPFGGSTIYRRHSCRACYNESQRLKSLARYKKDPEAWRAKKREYILRTTHKAPMPVDEYRAKARANAKRWSDNIRAETFAAYGGARCACCGESEFRFLCLDHVNNDGAEKRRQTNRSGRAYMAHLRSLGYPGGYRVLCFNCNCGRAYNGGICPHKEQV